MLETRTIDYQDAFYDLEIVVKQATLADDFRHGALVVSQSAAHPFDKKMQQDAFYEDWMRYHFHVSVYPALQIGTHAITNRDAEKRSLSLELSAEQMHELPSALVTLWQEAVFELNPQWHPFWAARKATTTASG